MQISRQVIDSSFSMLQQSLKRFALPTEDSGNRFASVEEFMLMNISGDLVHFKHILTRNYLYLDRFTGKISIPVGKPFHLGFFDEY